MLFGVDGHLLARLNGGGGFRAGNRQQAIVERVAVEDAAEADSDDRADAVVDQARGRLLAARPAAEIAPAHDHVAGLHIGGKGRVQVLQRVPRNLGALGDSVGVLSRKNHICIDIVAVFPGASVDVHRCSLWD